jgi:hypothetical protein
VSKNKDKNKKSPDTFAKTDLPKRKKKRKTKRSSKKQSFPLMNESIEYKDKQENFSYELANSSKDLIYISETDAEILPFIGEKAEVVDSRTLLKQIGESLDSPAEERDFEDFFRHLIKLRDWFDEEQINIANRFLALKKLLETNLKDLKVINIGRTDIDVYVVGLDTENNLMGIRTKAVET